MVLKTKAWFEKYRPKILDDIILPQSTPGSGNAPGFEETLTSFYNNEFIRGNILSYGPGGFGKTSLNEILVHKIIKHPDDIFISERKVEDIDRLKVWLQRKAISSTQKIVKIEEIDKLSAQAQTVLKDGLMEKYQSTCSFIATTNHPEKVDSSLLTRFNMKINFSELPKEGILKKLQFILSQESIQYKDEDVSEFIDRNSGKGLRDLINSLELASASGTFNSQLADSINFNSNENEQLIASYIVYLSVYTESKTTEELKNIIKNASSDSHFFQYYEYMLKLFKNDLSLNFDTIYKYVLDDKQLSIFNWNIVQEDYQKLDEKRFKSMHLISTIHKILLNIYQKSGGSVSKIGILEF